MKNFNKRKKTNHKKWKMIGVLRKFEWKHHNLILLLISFVFAYCILEYKPITHFIQNLEYLGYLAAFILGMLFTYALTSVPAASILFNLGNQLNPLVIALIGGLGSVISDYIIFRFVRDKLVKEIKLLSKEVDEVTKPVTDFLLPKNFLVMVWKSVSKSKVWKLLIPAIAGFIIASPLPDELGVALFGASKFEPKKFLVISYFLNFAGILVITSLGKIL